MLYVTSYSYAYAPTISASQIPAHSFFCLHLFSSLNYLLLSFVAVVICRTKNGNANEAKVKPVNVGEG